MATVAQRYRWTDGRIDGRLSVAISRNARSVLSGKNSDDKRLAMCQWAYSVLRITYVTLH